MHTDVSPAQNNRVATRDMTRYNDRIVGMIGKQPFFGGPAGTAAEKTGRRQRAVRPCTVTAARQYTGI